MNLADVFTVVFIILGFLTVFIAYWLMAAGLFPTFVARCSEQMGRAPVKTFLLGAVTFAPLVAVGLGISNKAPNAVGKSLGLGLALVAALGALFGSAGLALRIGTGLKAERDEFDPWRRVLRGGIVLGLTFVLPFVGTFLVMFPAFILGFGAFAICLFKRRGARATASLASMAAAPSPATVEVPPPAIPSVS